MEVKGVTAIAVMHCAYFNDLRTEPEQAQNLPNG